MPLASPQVSGSVSSSGEFHQELLFGTVFEVIPRCVQVSTCSTPFLNENCDLKIGDFGLARVTENQMTG
ncbi:hypothetical protein HK405_009372 [Cladochytrium tenue]|nr:hypothetical protein HK405_009372 [Cladochytrium tenue]